MSDCWNIWADALSVSVTQRHTLDLWVFLIWTLIISVLQSWTSNCVDLFSRFWQGIDIVALGGWRESRKLEQKYCESNLPTDCNHTKDWFCCYNAELNKVRKASFSQSYQLHQSFPSFLVKTCTVSFQIQMTLLCVPLIGQLCRAVNLTQRFVGCSLSSLQDSTRPCYFSRANVSMNNCSYAGDHQVWAVSHRLVLPVIQNPDEQTDRQLLSQIIMGLLLGWTGLYCLALLPHMERLQNPVYW